MSENNIEKHISGLFIIGMILGIPPFGRLLGIPGLIIQAFGVSCLITVLLYKLKIIKI